MEKQKVKQASQLLKNWLVWIITSITLCSLVIFVIFWWTNIFRNAILAELQLKNGTTTFAWWERPAVRAIYKTHIFNYTNVDDFESGVANKLKVQDMGPYIYRETLQRVNAVLHENGTVSYQEKRSYQWEGGRPDEEKLVVPNVPLFGAMAFSRDISFMAQVTLTAFLSTLGAKTFVKVSAGGFLWGYDDELFNYAKPLISLQQQIPFDKFGILAFKNGFSKDRFTIHTGSKDMDKLGMIQKLNGMESRKIWGDEKCDKITGTDGTMFPPKLFQNPNATLHVYFKEMCRTVPLHFYGHSRSQDIPTLRYKPTENIFTSSQTMNSCYCQKDKGSSAFTKRTCPPAGIFNASSCNFGLPTLTSFPHFYQADESLIDQIDGLDPQKELHESYIDLHPSLGVPIGGASRIQINLEARKADGVPFLGNIKDGMILPLIWIEVGIENIPDPVLNVLHHAYYTANIVEACFQWGSLITFILSISALFRILNKERKEKQAVVYAKENQLNIISGKIVLPGF